MFSDFEKMESEHVPKVSFKVWQEYMWSSVNVLPKGRKISDLTNRDVFQLNVSWINGNLE